MNKATITSPDAMAEEQIQEDIAMSPAQRLTLAFKISDFALELRSKDASMKDDSSSVVWIDLVKVSS